jgi:uncharacterized protein
VIIVSDTSPISNLIVVDSIDLLPQLFRTIVIPDVVYQNYLQMVTVMLSPKL